MTRCTWVSSSYTYSVQGARAGEAGGGGVDGRVQRQAGRLCSERGYTTGAPGDCDSCLTMRPLYFQLPARSIENTQEAEEAEERAGRPGCALTTAHLLQAPHAAESCKTKSGCTHHPPPTTHHPPPTHLLQARHVEAAAQAPHDLHLALYRADVVLPLAAAQSAQQGSRQPAAGVTPQAAASRRRGSSPQSVRRRQGRARWSHSALACPVSGCQSALARLAISLWEYQAQGRLLHQ